MGIKMKTNLPSNIHKQKGVAILTFSIILLIVLTLLGASSIDLSSMELRQARSLIEYNRAFQIAETALQQYINQYKIDGAIIPPVPYSKPNAPKDFVTIASYKAMDDPDPPAYFSVDNTLKLGDGGADIEMKRSENIAGSMYLIIQSIGYSQDKDDPNTFRVILNAGLKITLPPPGGGLNQ
jgi:hypothetical protein